MENNSSENNEITQEEIDAIYAYLSFFYNELTDEEKDFWKKIIEKYDSQISNDEEN